MRFAVRLSLAAVFIVLGCKSPSRPDAGVAAKSSLVVVDAGTPWRKAEALSLSQLHDEGLRLSFGSELDGGELQVFVTDFADGGVQQVTRGPQSHFAVPQGAFADRLLTIETVGDTEAHLEQLVWWSRGKPKPIGPASPRVRNPVLSSDAGFVVFESGHQGFSDLYRRRLDGSGLQRLTSNQEGNFEPWLSPDDRELVFTSSRTGDPEIFKLALQTPAEQTRLTEVSAEDLAPRWSPTGRNVVFTSSRNGSDQLFLMSPEGTGAIRVHPADAAVAPGGRGDVRVGPEAVEQDAAWSPDGRKLAYAVRARGEKFRLWLFDLDAERVVPLTDGAQHDEWPVWSPDGRYLAFISDETLWVMTADGSRMAQVSAERASLPVWLRSSRD